MVSGHHIRCCFHQGGGYAMVAVCLTWQSLCVQKLGVMIGSTNRNNLLTFGGDSVRGADSGSLFHFHHHCGIGDFRRFISVPHTVTGRFSWHDEMTDADKLINPQHSGSDQAEIQIRIRINPEIWIQIPDHLWLRSDALAKACAHSEHSLVCFCFLCTCPVFCFLTIFLPKFGR